MLRKRPSIKRMRTDVEEAIHELNTIVEERRLASRASSAVSNNDGHVPAIAPSMKMRVRSETLSDIGSAFSVPVASKPLPAMPEHSEDSDSDVDIKSQSSLVSARRTPLPYNIFTSAHYIPPTKPQAVYDHTQALSSPSLGTRPRSTSRRLTAWLRASLTPQPSPSSTVPKPPFYQLDTLYTTTASTPDPHLTSSSTLESLQSFSSSPPAHYPASRFNDDASDDCSGNAHSRHTWCERPTSRSPLTSPAQPSLETETETEVKAERKLPDLLPSRPSTSKRSFSQHLQLRGRERGMMLGCEGRDLWVRGEGVGVGVAY